jgi:hypothetical protein
VAELEVGDLQLGSLAADNGMLLAPVELERLARAKGQRHEDTAAGSLLLALPVVPPGPHKGGDPPVRAIVAQPRQLGVELSRGAFLFAWPAGIRPQPGGQPLGKRIQLAGPIGCPEHRLHRLGPQVLADGVPRQAGPAGDRADRQVLPKCQRRITLNNAMSNTPAAPAQKAEASVRTWVNSQWQLHPTPGQVSDLPQFPCCWIAGRAPEAQISCCSSLSRDLPCSSICCP